MAKHTVGLILHPERVSRLIDYHSRNKDYPGLSVVLDHLIAATWLSVLKSGTHAEIQRVVDNIFLGLSNKCCWNAFDFGSYFGD